MKQILLLFFFGSLLSLMSCQQIRPLVPVVGVYDGFVIGQSDVFAMNVSVGGSEDIIIDAPINGFDFTTFEANLSNNNQEIIRIDFCSDALDRNIFICGDGYYFDNSLQLDYEVDSGGFVEVFSLVATKR